MKLTLTVCDVCQDQDKPANSYEIRRLDDGATANPDLCDEHAAPLEALFATDVPKPKPQKATTSKTKATRPKTAAVRRRDIQVKTMEDIEREKAERA
ncbi:hypothetical protein ALI22I_34010 [Saccharothrix sp. ALI-22-I]|uniref:hypothetical protein n=1 Tax=Saccharothrix sp. ALI-22-I TaxID=1933778 RepID=UPI00097C8B98|nr:hypothetical protein [Saccharothrix sp. ALI-22-I]ONI83511.1 hypothetical protein ALI22I_34010 [Saccharothrix sp. ALI-22-I]